MTRHRSKRAGPTMGAGHRGVIDLSTWCLVIYRGASDSEIRQRRSRCDTRKAESSGVTALTRLASRPVFDLFPRHSVLADKGISA